MNGRVGRWAVWSVGALSLVAAPLPAQTGGELGFSEPALDRLVERARESESDALVVWFDGQLLCRSTFDRPEGPIEAMSATKSVIALAFGTLIAAGKLDSLDEPVAGYFPEWKQGRKANVTIRHLLGNRSGLQNVSHTGVEIYPSPDFVQLALCAELDEEPGAAFRYNNKAFNLSAGVGGRIAGMPFDEWIGAHLFAPIGITDWTWTRDAAGNPHGMSGLQIRAEDLVKIGRLMLDEGRWDGKPIVPAEFVREMTRDQAHPADPSRAGQISELWGRSYGLGWWVIDEPQWAITDRLLASWKESGAPADFVERLGTLRGESGPDLATRAAELAGGSERWNALTWQADRPDFDIVERSPIGFSADGYLGQYLVVLPQHRLVAARMRRTPAGDFDPNRLDTMRDFADLVRALVE